MHVVTLGVFQPLLLPLPMSQTWKSDRPIVDLEILPQFSLSFLPWAYVNRFPLYKFLPLQQTVPDCLQTLLGLEAVPCLASWGLRKKPLGIPNPSHSHHRAGQSRRGAPPSQANQNIFFFVMENATSWVGRIQGPHPWTLPLGRVQGWGLFFWPLENSFAIRLRKISGKRVRSNKTKARRDRMPVWIVHELEIGERGSQKVREYGVSCWRRFL